MTPPRRLMVWVAALFVVGLPVVAGHLGGGGPGFQGFHSGLLDPGDSWSLSVDELVDSVRYKCNIHPGHEGVLHTSLDGNASEPRFIDLTATTHFDPDNLTVTLGANVTWVNRDNQTHTVTQIVDEPDIDGGNNLWTRVFMFAVIGAGVAFLIFAVMSMRR